MKIPATALLVFTACFSFAQPKIINVAFLKNGGKYVNVRDSADYLRFTSEPDSGSTFYNIAEYYKDGTKKLIGKSSKIEPPVFEGQCARFYKNGGRRSTTNYKKNRPVGDEYAFYTNGKPYMVIEYPDNNDMYPDITNNFLIKANYDSLGRVLVKNGNGYYKGYDEKFNYISEEGPVKNGKRDSVWKGNFKNLKTTFTETYKDGTLINGTATFDDGTSATYTKTRGTAPEFKGGLDAFYKYLGKNIAYPDDAKENNTQGQVVLAFVVEKDGSISDVVVSKSVSPSIDAEAVRVLKKSPHWIPGTQFGRPARIKYSLPVSFSLGGN